MMPKSPMNWSKPCAYDMEQKKRFHAEAGRRLADMARYHLNWYSGIDYDLRHNRAGIAVSGEITLHHDRIYIQVLQSALGHGMGILVRSCQGRRDFQGGANHFFPLAMLDNLPKLAQMVIKIMRVAEHSGYFTANKETPS